MAEPTPHKAEFEAGRALGQIESEVKNQQDQLTELTKAVSDFRKYVGLLQNAGKLAAMLKSPLISFLSGTVLTFSLAGAFCWHYTSTVKTLAERLATKDEFVVLEKSFDNRKNDYGKKGYINIVTPINVSSSTDELYSFVFHSISHNKDFAFYYCPASA